MSQPDIPYTFVAFVLVVIFTVIIGGLNAADMLTDKDECCPTGCYSTCEQMEKTE